MWVIYRNGTFGYYVEALTDEKYRWWIGPDAWSGNWPSECCRFFPVSN